MNHALPIQTVNNSGIALIERALTRCIELAVAALLTVVICLLMSGVIARYVLHVPLVWSDELTSILFLWLAMLGASLATQRMAHMRMTAIVNRLGDRWSNFFEAFSPAAAIAFLALVIWPAYHYASEEAVITTSALEVSNAWRAAAMPVGIVLMTVFSLLRLAEKRHNRQTALAVLLVAALLAAFWFAGPLLKGLGSLNLVIFFVGVVGLAVFSGVSIAVAFGLATLGFLALTTRVPLMTLVGRMDEGMSHLLIGQKYRRHLDA
jgi:TRAP-type C4-dicarboxylate transport system permease small subunit